MPGTDGVELAERFSPSAGQPILFMSGASCRGSSPAMAFRSQGRLPGQAVYACRVVRTRLREALERRPNRVPTGKCSDTTSPSLTVRTESPALPTSHSADGLRSAVAALRFPQRSRRTDASAGSAPKLPSGAVRCLSEKTARQPNSSWMSLSLIPGKARAIDRRFARPAADMLQNRGYRSIVHPRSSSSPIRPWRPGRFRSWRMSLAISAIHDLLATFVVFQSLPAYRPGHPARLPGPIISQHIDAPVAGVTVAPLL